MRPGVNGTFTSTPASFAAFSTAAPPPRTIRSASETSCRCSFWIASSFCSTVASCAGSLTSQSFCGRGGCARRSRRRACRSRGTSRPTPRRSRRVADTDRPDARIFAFSAVDVRVADRRMRRRRDRVLPDQRLLRHERAEVAHARTHVAVRELEPRARERVRELVRVLKEAPRDLLVGRIDPQREVRRQHHRHMLLRRVEGIRDRGLRRPSPSTAARRPGSSSAPIRFRTGS